MVFLPQPVGLPITFRVLADTAIRYWKYAMTPSSVWFGSSISSSSSVLPVLVRTYSMTW